MKIGIPVKCQNGHKAIWRAELHGLDVLHRGVAEAEKCDCPKHDIGQGYFADGEPFLLEQAKADISASVDEAFKAWEPNGNPVAGAGGHLAAKAGFRAGWRASAGTRELPGANSP